MEQTEVVYAADKYARNLLTYHGYNFTPRYVIDTGGNKSLSIDREINTKKSNNIAVYPNPASNQVNFVFNFDTKSSTDLQLEVLDISGKVLFTQKINVDTENYVWNTTAISDGIYFYRVYSDKAIIENGKIIINK